MKRTKRFAALMLSVATVAASLAGCGSSESSKAQTTSQAETQNASGETGAAKVLKIGFGYDASSLDPGMASDDATLIPVSLCNEALFRMVNGEAQPGIAETYEASEDGKEWTFHLRDSKWADGSDLTAEDFKYSILRMVNPESALDKATACYFIQGA